LTDNMFSCVPVAEAGKRFYIGKNPVTNGQYERFVNHEDFADVRLWQQPEVPRCFDPERRAYVMDEGGLHWIKGHSGDERLPEFWSDPSFGISHRGLPVVGINWYEADAYCRWLFRHWDELEEAQSNPGVLPKSIRLPTEWEWFHAVCGPNPGNRFPWESVPHLETENPLTEALTRFANVGKALDHTSPVGMFPQGVTHLYGLVDTFGNAWEWQANYFDRSYRAFALRGGAYTTATADAGCDLRGCGAPAKRDSDLGFRILIEV
jgi:formylglycine-generating enzyme required for sulfatase activity